MEEELAKGWLFEMDSLASAQARFGSKLAIGKMSIVSAPGKKPRLVVDSTVCGTNPSCLIPETFALPSVDDVRECFPLRMHAGKLAGFALDVKSAHKTVRVRPADQGLLGVTLPSADGLGSRYLFYQVCPFGANFSALWFQRLGSFFIRTLHLWIWLRHALLGYVDDFLLVQDEDVIVLFFCLVLAFCAMFGIPISHAKLQLGRGIVWIGWHFGFGSDILCALGVCSRRLLLDAMSIVEPWTRSWACFSGFASFSVPSNPGFSLSTRMPTGHWPPITALLQVIGQVWHCFSVTLLSLLPTLLTRPLSQGVDF